MADIYPTCFVEHAAGLGWVELQAEYPNSIQDDDIIVLESYEDYKQRVAPRCQVCGQKIILPSWASRFELHLYEEQLCSEYCSEQLDDLAEAAQERYESSCLASEYAEDGDHP